MKKLEGWILVLENDNRLLQTLPVSIKSLKEKIEEQTNRQLRETLVRNLPELKPDESYNDDKELLAKLISGNVIGVSFEHVFNQIKQVHREMLRKDREVNSLRKGKWIIFMVFQSWDLWEKMKESFGLKCISNIDFNISVDQKYGPFTTQRRHKEVQYLARLLTSLQN